jgi:hypothetical protein
LSPTTNLLPALNLYDSTTYMFNFYCIKRRNMSKNFFPCQYPDPP